MISILIPHLRTPENDKALHICLECIADNTAADYELVIEAVAERRDIYGVLNRMVSKAAGEWIVFGNSDVFFAPGWIQPMLDAAAPDTIVAGVIVECGAIGVSTLNHHRNFGMRPETFDRAAFEQWCIDSPEMPGGQRAWYFPSLHHRETFLSMGGFDTTKGVFPIDPLDAEYWDRWEASGRHFTRVASYCYHLQFFSSDFEQNKPVRYE